MALAIDGAKTQTKVIKVATRKTETVTFTVAKDKPAIHNIEVNNLTGTFQVRKPAEFAASNQTRLTDNPKIDAQPE